MLLSSWATTAELPGPVAWLSLDAADNDPARFWSHLLAALRQSGAAPPGGRLSGLGLPIGGPDHGFLLGLAAALTELAGPVVVVLDDFHQLTNPAVLDGLVTVLGRSPAALRVVLASREDLPPPLSRLRVAGRPIEVGAAELAFTAAEAAKLLAAHGLVLADADLELVWARTEGWAAGLRLAALSLEGHPDPEGFIAGFTGSSRAVADFLLEEVLGRLPEEDQAFLLHTSVVERVSGDLADALTGRADGAQTLARLERINAFVVALGQDGSWYRYHQLFAELLLARLQAGAPRLVSELHRRAAGWYQDHGCPVEAIRHALAGGQWPLAAELLATIWQDFILDGEMALLGQLMDQFPAEVVETDAELVTVRAARWLGAGDWDGADSDLRHAEQVAATLVQRRRRRFEVTLATVSLYRARLRGDLGPSFGNKVGEHRPGELLGDRVHDHDVKPAAHAHRPSATAAYPAEAGLLIATDRGRVPGKHHQVHVVQPEHGERPVEHEPGGLSPQPLATPLAQHDPEGGRPMPVINVDETGGADRLQVNAVIDEEVGLAWVRLGGLLIPALLRFDGVDDRVPEPPGDLKGGHPAGIDRNQVLAKRPECHTLAGDDQVGDRLGWFGQLSPPGRAHLGLARHGLPHHSRGPG